jgi:hypothetical protein
VQPHLKIKRAEEHIAQIKAAINSLPNRYTSIVEKDLEARRQWIKYELPQATDFRDTLGLVIGDAVHNLRTALDYAWIQALTILKCQITNYSKFPVFETLEALKNALVGIKIDVASPIFNCLMSEIQPYRTGDDLIYTLHELDIADKHRLLTPVVQVADASGIKTEDKNGIIFVDRTSPIRGTDSFYVEVPFDHQIKENGKPSVAVLFEKGSPSEDGEITSTLALLKESTVKAVEAIEHSTHP